MITHYSVTRFTDGNERIGGHHMSNYFANYRNVSLCLSQSILIKWHKMLTYSHSIVDDKNMPLLYPEGLLFPKIFWALSNGISVCSLLSVFYSEISHGKSCGRESFRGRILGFKKAADRKLPPLGSIHTVSLI